MTDFNDVDWLVQCRQCKHYYQVKADADEVRCRLKYCRYEPFVDEKKFRKMQHELNELDRKDEDITSLRRY